MIVRKLALAGGGAAPNFAVGSNDSPRLFPYRYAAGNIYATPSANTAPTGNVPLGGVRFSPSKGYLAVSHSTTPYLSVYKKTGVNLVKLANPASLAGVNGAGVAWAPANDYVGMILTGSPYVKFYSLAADVLTSVTPPTVSNTKASIAWSPGGYLAVSGGTAPRLEAWSVSGVTYTTMTVGTDLSGAASALDWSPDSALLAATQSSSPYVRVYSRSGTTLTLLSNPASLPTGTAQAVRFSPASTYLAVGHDVSPYITVYSISGTTLTKLTNPGTLPVSVVQAISWHADGSGFTACEDDKIHLYSVSGATVTFVRTISPSYSSIRAVDE